MLSSQNGVRVSLLLLAALVIVVKLPTLTTPAYWDEMSWVRQADWLYERNLLQALPGLHPRALFFGHPPGLHITLAALWKLSSPSMFSAHLLIACFAALGICATFLLARQPYGSKTALFSALFLLLSPLYMAQSGMFLGDIPVTALGVLSIYLALNRRYVSYLVCACAMVLIKETAAALIVAIILYRFAIEKPITKRSFTQALKYSIPLFALGLFLLLQKIMTGKFFFIYNFELELFHFSTSYIRNQLRLITNWIFVYQDRYLFTALIMLNLAFNAKARKRQEMLLFLLILLLSGYSFLVLFFLPRYLLPVLPFFYILAAVSLIDLMRSKKLQTAAGIAVLCLMAWSLATQPFTANAEFNMGYLDVVRMHKKMIDELASEFPNARVLTTFPNIAQLDVPVLGYVRKPLKTKEFHRDADLEESDLILVTTPNAREMVELQELAKRKMWPLIRQLKKGPIQAELYGRPALAGNGGLE